MAVAMLWSEHYSVKVREIDEQHKRFLGIINCLHEAMSADAREAPRSILHDLADYADLHFATEEQYMLRFAFPGLADHVAEHDRFRAQVRSLQARADRQGFLFTLELLNFLKDWLQNHILITDMKYSRWFNDHGLT